MSDTSTDQRLYDIYDGMLDAIKKKLKNPADVTAADIQATLSVLKANGITSIRRPGNKLDEVATALEDLEVEKFPFAVGPSILPKDDPAVKAASSE